MTAQVITYVDPPRAHDEDEAIAEIGDATYLGSLADDVLDVIDDIRHGEDASKSPALETARSVYSRLAKQVLTPADFFATVAWTAPVQRVTGIRFLKDGQVLSHERREALSSHFDGVATALRAVQKHKASSENLEMVQKEFELLSKLTLDAARMAAERSIRNSPWSGS